MIWVRVDDPYKDHDTPYVYTTINPFYPHKLWSGKTDDQRRV